MKNSKKNKNNLGNTQHESQHWNSETDKNEKFKIKMN